MQWSHLNVFVAVAQIGGFKHAADALDMAPSSVTRAIANLEKSLGVRLFQRTTRNVALTEAGEKFLKQVAPAMDEVRAAADSLKPGTDNLSGTLKVSASVAFAETIIAPNLADFCDSHPQLEIEFLLSDTRIDLISERVDLAVRHGGLEDSSLVAQRLATVNYHLVASREYADQKGPITHPQDLVDHRCLSFPYPVFQNNWCFESERSTCEVEIESSIKISNALTIAASVKAGVGVALLADWMVDKDIANGSMIHLLPEWSVRVAGSTGSALWLVTPSRAFLPAKVTAFRDFLQSALSHVYKRHSDESKNPKDIDINS